MRILTEMADIVVADLGDDRRLEIQDGSAFAEVLGSQRTRERDAWFRGYFGNRIVALLASIIDSAYRLDTVLATPSPAGISVVEYNILRPMYEYEYKLFRLVKLENKVSDREQFAIEDWKVDYRQFQKVASEIQVGEQMRQFEKWEAILNAWYKELTCSERIREPSVRDIFDEIVEPESWWPKDRGDNPINPVYLSAYSVLSAVEHANLWAMQKLTMSDPSATSTRGAVLDDATSLSLQAAAGTILQLAYGSIKQFADGRLDASMMNRLGAYLSTIERMKAELSSEQ